MPKSFYGNGNAGPSLNEQIERAKTIGDVHALLVKGRSFRNYSSRSGNRWKRTAKRRIAELQGATR